MFDEFGKAQIALIEMQAKAIGSFVSFCKDHRIADKLKYFGANLVRFVTAIGWLFVASYVYYIVIRYSVVDSIAMYHHVKSSEATYPQFMFMIGKIALSIAILIGPIFGALFLALISDEYLKNKFYWYI